MGSWNYRVVRQEHPQATEFKNELFQIHEAFYVSEDGAGKPYAITEKPIAVFSESLGGLRWTLDKMREALDKPVLDFTTREELPDG